MKKGDRAVCINDDCIRFGYKYLTKGKIYNIIRVSTIDDGSIKRFIYYVNDDSNTEYGYYAERFINLSEIRRLKILKLNNLK
jgi:hypothetical protein